MHAFISAPGPTELFGDRLRRLRTARGLSRSQLSRQTYGIDGVGLPEVTIKFLETGKRKQPTMDTMVLLARALDVPPEEFAEYRLALARQQLDEREVGLDKALGNLERLEAAMRRRPPKAAGARASEPAEASPQPRRAGRSAGESRSEG